MKIYRKATRQQRLISVVLLLFIAAFFTTAFLMASGKLNLSRWTTCGFRQRYGLPCPSCYMTTASLLFVEGNFVQSFVTQPAAFVLCVVLVITGFLSFLSAVFGIYFTFIDYFSYRANVKYIILAVLVIAAAGWIVTLARTFAERGQ